MDKVKKILINIAGTLAFPVIVFVVFFAVTHLANTPSVFSFNLIPNVVQNIGVGILIALGMSVNMATFRIDLSAGAVTTLTAIVVGSIAVDHGWPGWLFMIVCMVSGVICSTFNGAVYAFLRLPSMIVSLGVTMVLESITVLYRGGKGVTILTGPIREFGGAPTIFIILILAMIVFHVVMEYTGFGFDQKAFAGNKRIAVDNGKKERKNVIISYAFTFSLAPLNEGTICSISTMIRSRPVMICCHQELMFPCRLIMLPMMARMNTPKMVVSMLPDPPARLVPPMATEAMASISQPLQATGCPVPALDTRIRPASAEANPEIV